MIYGLACAGSAAHRGSITKREHRADLEEGSWERGKPVPSGCSCRKVSTREARADTQLGQLDSRLWVRWVLITGQVRKPGVGT